MYAPLSTVIDDVVGDISATSYTILAVQATSRDTITSAVHEITAALRQTHAIKPGMPLDFRSSTPPTSSPPARRRPDRSRSSWPSWPPSR